MNRLLHWILVSLVALAALPALADERILDFHSDIVVEADAGMRVTETIRVRAEGLQIRHGIYRDFPPITATASAIACACSSSRWR